MVQGIRELLWSVLNTQSQEPCRHYSRVNDPDRFIAEPDWVTDPDW